MHIAESISMELVVAENIREAPIGGLSPQATERGLLIDKDSLNKFPL